LEVTFWGVRGSIPTGTAETVRWGGNTSCLEVTVEGCPVLVLDAGTGARPLGQKLANEHVRHVRVLLTHLHADHLFGLPFFAPLYTPGAEVSVTLPAWSEDEARERVARWLNGTFHPVRLREIPAALTFHAARPGRALPFDDVHVVPIRLNHPGGSVGYRVDARGRSLAYLTDTAPFARPGEGVAAGEPPTSAEARVLAALEGCHTVVYDTMYDLEEYLLKMTWGHSYPEYALALCRAAGVERVVLFHHAPDASDDDVDARVARFAGHAEPVVHVAREGETLTI
jgi:phosphoribosyl 1,2-cyclic phosphodiesterase